jgi:plasmid maintenance system antidote protein VapI
MDMSGNEMREHLEKLEIGQTELARWLGVKDRTIRHYISGKRHVPPSLALLLEYLDDRPEAKQWFIEREMKLRAAAQ